MNSLLSSIDSVSDEVNSMSFDNSTRPAELINDNTAASVVRLSADGKLGSSQDTNGEASHGKCCLLNIDADSTNNASIRNKEKVSEDLCKFCPNWPPYLAARSLLILIAALWGSKIAVSISFVRREYATVYSSPWLILFTFFLYARMHS